MLCYWTATVENCVVIILLGKASQFLAIFIYKEITLTGLLEWICEGSIPMSCLGSQFVQSSKGNDE